MPNATDVVSVIITGNNHRLQYRRMTLSDSAWLVTMNEHSLPNMVDTAHVQMSMQASAECGFNVHTFKD